MAFHDVQFPAQISFGSSGGPMFNTTVLAAASGHEQRVIRWNDIRAEYNAAHGIKERLQMDALLAFFYARQGRAHSFRYKDWSDYTLLNQVIGTGDGATLIFQIVKTYTSGSQTYSRDITKPISGSLTGVLVGAAAQVEGVDFTVDYLTGLMTFVVAPPSMDDITIGAGEFDVPARFDTDHMDVTFDFWETQSWPDIPIVEVRE